MTGTPEFGHTFNDDLLLQPDSRSTATAAYPKYAFALDFEPLRELFEPIDAAANAAKARSRRWGVFAIGMGTLALLLAAAEPTYHNLSPRIRDFVGLTAAALGIAGAITGTRVILYSGAKRAWLVRRFVAERIRQFHFQNLVMRLPELVAAETGDRRQEFLAKSNALLHAFSGRLFAKTDVEFAAAISDEDGPDWLVAVPDGATVQAINQDGEEFFRAYRDLRIIHQLNYARHKLRSPRTLFDFPCRRQETFFGRIGIGCIALLFLVHIVFALSIPVGGIIGPLGHVAIISIAIFALAAKALEEGLQPQRETERNEHYVNRIRVSLDRFDAAKTPEERFVAMLEVERLSYEEMKLFLRANTAARFLI